MGKELTLDFGEITFRNKDLSAEQKVENKMVSKIKKHRFKKEYKMSSDIGIIKKLVNELDGENQVDLISKAFDSPSIVLSYKNEIKKLYIATWAITPAGISALEEISKNGIIEECIVLLDMTHSYKWIFQSEAYKILKGRVKFKFMATHSKYICYQLADGSVINFIGSMNFSNNPRFENIQINKDPLYFEFYTGFITKTGGQIV